MGAIRLLWKDIEKSEGNKQGICRLWKGAGFLGLRVVLW